MEDKLFDELLEELALEADKESFLLRALHLNSFSEAQLQLISKLEVVGSSVELTRLLTPLDGECLDRLIKERDDSVRYFSVGNKQERERFVVRSFLELMGIDYKEKDLVSPAEDPPDIEFEDARIEIKEVLDSDRTRHKEYKEALASARKNIRTIQIFKLSPVRTVTHSELSVRVKEELSGLSDKYPASTRSQLDLLLYINLLDVLEYTGPLPSSVEFAEFGWRSISAVTGSQAWVYQANGNVPLWIAASVGMVKTRI